MSVYTASQFQQKTDWSDLSLVTILLAKSVAGQRGSILINVNFVVVADIPKFALAFVPTFYICRVEGSFNTILNSSMLLL